jgi:predicted permease
MESFIFMVITLPTLVIKEALKGDNSDLKKNEAVLKVLYTVLVIFILLFISIWLWSHR